MDFWDALPTGKEVKPLLFAMDDLVYDYHDVDGQYYMLDRELSGCLLLMWAKPMDPAHSGVVTLDGLMVPGCILKPMAVMGGMWILGIPLRGLVTEAGKTWQLHVEGYTDTDGNQMNPQDFTVKGPDTVLPLPQYAAHEQVALDAARDGIVLMKNQNHALPLPANTVLNLFGKGVHEFRNGAVGAGKINPRYSVSFLDAVRKDPAFSLNEELISFYVHGRDEMPGNGVLQRAKENSDYAFVLISRAAGENNDASSLPGEYALTPEEANLIETVSKAFPHTIVLLNTGYPMDVSFALSDRIDAVVWCGFGGMLGGEALLDILSGRVNPSGKLPDTWAGAYEANPAARNFYDAADGDRYSGDADVYLDTCYEEDVYVGYRYFSSFRKTAVYPFGHGLSYTTFEVNTQLPGFDGQSLTVKGSVRNSGDRAGREVIQIYVGKPESLQEQPERELVWFEKTQTLQPGEVQFFEAHIPLNRLATWLEAQDAWVLSPGNYRVYTGSSTRAPLCGTFSVEQAQTLRKLKKRIPCPVPFERLSKANPVLSGKYSGIQAEKASHQPYAIRDGVPFSAAQGEGIDQASPSGVTFRMVCKNPSLADAFTAQLDAQQLARLSICASAGWGMEGIGEAGRVFQPDGLDIPDFPVSDGNSGVNLKIKNIGMPSGTTLAATFDHHLMEQVGRVIGEEARDLGIRLILAPGFNIHRHPLCGRTPEYFSEDPYLSGNMAGYYARGLESTGVGACYKHLIGNNCESARKRNQSLISQRAIREIYFRNFEYALDIHHPASVMTAYNAVNGVPTAADADLILGMLREECGYQGFVMTDWTTYDTVDIPAMLQAGNCWITPGSTDDTYVQPVLDALRDGRLDINRLRKNVTALIRTMAEFETSEKYNRRITS